MYCFTVTVCSDIRKFESEMYCLHSGSSSQDERRVKRRLSSGQYEVGCKVPLSRSCTAFSYPNIQTQNVSNGTKQLTLTVIDSGNAAKVLSLSCNESVLVNTMFLYKC